MEALTNIKRIYFLGIGGIGMSAIARYFNSPGVFVAGYDKTPTVLTRLMQNEGIHIHFDDSIDLLDKDADLVVYTPAVPPNHKEFSFYKQHGYPTVKRSEVLQKITENSFNICVAGTHGKTTMSTMIAHILRSSSYPATAFLGGISVNYNTNFWSFDTKVCVVEADEYDRSFLRLSPDIAVISAMDADHLDIYGTEENMQQAFIDFTGKIKPNGLLVSKYGLKRHADLKGNTHITYSLQDTGANAFAANITPGRGYYTFDVINRGWTLKGVVLNMGGMHNIENAVAAIIVAHQLQITDEDIKQAVSTFQGVKRRFEYIIAPPALQQLPGSGQPGAPVSENIKEIIFIDDYAHHPEELRALISSTKNLFPDLKCTVVFQPHLFTRTRDFAAGFAQSLDLADEIILLPIYPAREMPIEGVSSEMILSKMKNPHKRILEKNDLLAWLSETHQIAGKGEVFITAGAGDIDTLLEPLKHILKLKMT